MKKLILTTAFLLSILSVQAQDFFSDKRPVQSANEFTKKVNDISYDIDLIIINNKEKLKQELNEIDQKVENNQLTKAEADKLRNEKIREGAWSISRFKGLGEMSYQELWETTMDPDHRILKQVQIEDAAAADETFSMLMGDEVEPRRLFIQRNARNVSWIDA